MLSFAAFIALTVFARIATFLMLFYVTGGALGSSTRGMPLHISTLITYDQVDMLRSHLEINLWGSPLTIVPGLNRFLVLETDNPILNLEAKTLCDSSPNHPFPTFLILQPSDNARYQQVVSALDLARRYNSNSEHCKILIMVRRNANIDA